MMLEDMKNLNKNVTLCVKKEDFYQRLQVMFEQTNKNIDQKARSLKSKVDEKFKQFEVS